MTTAAGYRGIDEMHNKKPDALLILAALFAAGVLFSALSHGDAERLPLATVSTP